MLGSIFTDADLTASNRWMVSGTPFINSIDDLNGELQFLKVWPFSLSDSLDGFWQKKIGGPFAGVASFLFDLQSPIAWRSVSKMTIRSDSEPPNVVVDMEIHQYYHSPQSSDAGTEP